MGVIPGQEAIDSYDDPRKWAIAALDIPLNGRIGKLIDLALDHLAHHIAEAGSVYVSDAAWRLDRLRFRQGTVSLANMARRQRFDENSYRTQCLRPPHRGHAVPFRPVVILSYRNPQGLSLPPA